MNGWEVGKNIWSQTVEWFPLLLLYHQSLIYISRAYGWKPFVPSTGLT